MKNINDWQKEQKLNHIGTNWAEWYFEKDDHRMKTYREWKIRKNLDIMLEEGPPVQPGQLPPPDPNQPPGPPPPGQSPGGQPPQPPGPPPGQEVPPPETPPPAGPEAPPVPDDDKALIGNLKGILGESPKGDEFASTAAMREEVKKVMSLAQQKQKNPADGLKMWLWRCISVWQKEIKQQQPKQPQQPQPQQGQPPAPPPGAAPPGQPPATPM